MNHIEKVTNEKEIATTRILTLQSCYYSAVKFAKMDQSKSQKFCSKFSDDMTKDFSDVQSQMNKIIDAKYRISF